MAELAILPGSVGTVATRPTERKLSHDSKRAAVLRVFLERGQRGLNRFEAERLAHDHCLNSTISECVRFHGIEFAKRFEKVPCLGGTKTTDVVRYALTAEGAARVHKLLGQTILAAA